MRAKFRAIENKYYFMIRSYYLEKVFSWNFCSKLNFCYCPQHMVNKDYQKADT